MVMLRSCVKLLLIFLIWHFAANGWAQSYPVKIVRYLVPAAAGSGADTIGRIIAGGLAQVFGQRVIVDNRAGGGFNIGAEVIKRLSDLGYVPIGGHPAEFAKFIKSDIEKWRKVIREKGLTGMALT